MQIGDHSLNVGKYGIHNARQIYRQLFIGCIQLVGIGGQLVCHIDQRAAIGQVYQVSVLIQHLCDQIVYAHRDHDDFCGFYVSTERRIGLHRSHQVAGSCTDLRIVYGSAAQIICHNGDCRLSVACLCQAVIAQRNYLTARHCNRFIGRRRC